MPLPKILFFFKEYTPVYGIYGEDKPFSTELWRRTPAYRHRARPPYPLPLGCLHSISKNFISKSNTFKITLKIQIIIMQSGNCKIREGCFLYFGRYIPTQKFRSPPSGLPTLYSPSFSHSILHLSPLSLHPPYSTFSLYFLTCP